MSAGCVLLRWQCSEAPAHTAAELAGGPFDFDALLALVPQTVSKLEDSQCLIVRVSRISVSEVRRVQEAFAKAGGPARVCLAARRSAVEHLADIGEDDVGLLLDGIDSSVPCSELIWHGFEAARFR